MLLRTSDPTVDSVTVNGRTYQGHLKTIHPRSWVFNVTKQADVDSLIGEGYTAVGSRAASEDLTDGPISGGGGVSEHQYIISGGLLGLTELVPGSNSLLFSSVDFNNNIDITPVKSDLSAVADLVNDAAGYLNVDAITDDPRSAYQITLQVGLNDVPVDGMLTVAISFVNTLGDSVSASQSSTFIAALVAAEGDNPVVTAQTPVSWVVAADFTLPGPTAYALIIGAVTWSPSDGTSNAGVNSYKMTIQRLS